MALVQTPAEMIELTNQLQEYIETFSSVARYLNKLADGKVKSWEVTDLEEDVVETLRGMKTSGTPWRKEVAAALLKEVDEYSPQGSSKKIFECARLLCPSLLGETPVNEMLTASEMSAVCHLHFDNTEWQQYLGTAPDDLEPDEVSDPQLWWSRREEAYPSLYHTAMFLLRLPAVVTSCDGLMSLEGTLFTKRQRRLEPQLAGRMLQWSANGDYLSMFDSSIRKSWFSPN